MDKQLKYALNDNCIQFKQVNFHYNWIKNNAYCINIHINLQLQKTGHEVGIQIHRSHELFVVKLYQKIHFDTWPNV